MKCRHLFTLLVLMLVLQVPPVALAQAGQENPIPANAPCESKSAAACEQVRMGIKAFREGKFEEAANFFAKAADLDTSYVHARIYLGTALAQQYVPGAESQDNLRIAKQAIEAFEAVLKLDAKNTLALRFIAQLYYSQKQLDKAKEYQLRLIEVDPRNPEPYYWVGVLDWIVCWQRTQKLRKDLHLDTPRPDNPTVLPPLPEEARTQLASHNSAAVAEGLQNLQKAIELKPDYVEAMAYLNLLYRQKADLETSEDARQEDLRIADEWVNKSLEAHRKQSSQHQ